VAELFEQERAVVYPACCRSAVVVGLVAAEVASADSSADLEDRSASAVVVGIDPAEARP